MAIKINGATVISDSQAITTTSTISATGNVTAGNVSVTGTVTAAGINTGSSPISTTGNVTGGNVLTSGIVSATGAITGSSSSVTGTQSAASTVGGVITGSSSSVTGDVTGANLTTAGTATIGGFTISGNTIVSAGSTLTLDPNGPGGTTGLVVVAGNLQVDGTTTTINSNVVSTNDLTVNYANNAINSAAANGGGIEIGPIGSPFITFLYNNVADVFTSSAGISAVGGVTAASVTTSGTATVNSANNATAIANGGTSGSGNIGASGATFNTVFAKATTAQYADLAEKYTADADYVPGTVLVFGGSAEVTVDAVDADRRVAGVVSTNPGLLMNEGLDTAHAVAIAFTGRVPCFVVGPVAKGDLMVAAGLGRARAEADPKPGSIIGKALEDFEGESGTIEVVVGRF
jgi:hypothetical protein